MGLNYGWHGMFSGCSSLVSLDLSNFDTSKVTEIGYMFGSCYNLTTINLSNADFSNVIEKEGMFDGVPINSTITVKDETQKEWIANNFPTLSNVIVSY
jgi:surface protein